ncbi:MAG TPA: DNA-binding response regulator [Cyanothece sp. UBA12306]|nr:DNA-binding response regulator [Cyanothece sp. UBA12306]
MKILLVDDEPELTEPLSQILSHEGYEVDVADNGNIGYQLALENPYDLLILDWMLPNKPGIEICQTLRSQGNTTPVLFLTAKDTLDDRVLGLDAGADDYLVKPFELRELMARVRALLRRSPHLDPEASKKLKIADLELDRNNQIAYRQGRGVNLSDKEVQLLSYFMEHPGQLLTHEQIYQHLWQQTEQPNSNVVAALIRLLRRKIEAQGEVPLIHTVYGKGYRFGN